MGLVCWSVGATITEYPRLGSLQTTDIYLSQIWLLGVQGQVASVLDVWWGPLLGSRLAIFSYCPHEKGLGALWGVFYKGTNPIPEGFTFITNHLTKAPSTNTFTLGIRFKHKNLRWGDTTIYPIPFGLAGVLTCVCAQSHLTLCDPVDCNLPGSSVHRIFQTRILEWVAISYSKGSS